MPSRAPSTRVRVLVVALVLLLGYGFSIAARTGLADAYAEPAKDFLQAKRDADEVLTPDEWQAVDDSLGRALALVPGDPGILSELGRLHRILLEADDLGAEEIVRQGDAAVAYYQAALALRPTWPWDWGNLALVKYEQYQDSSRIYADALVRAVAFGPREPSLQYRVAELGSDSWPALDPAAAESVLIAADRALERDAQAFSDLSEATERWQPLCAQAGDSLMYLRHFCRMLELT